MIDHGFDPSRPRVQKIREAVESVDRDEIAEPVATLVHIGACNDRLARDGRAMVRATGRRDAKLAHLSCEKRTIAFYARRRARELKAAGRAFDPDGPPRPVENGSDVIQTRPVRPVADSASARVGVECAARLCAKARENELRDERILARERANAARTATNRRTADD